MSAREIDRFEPRTTRPASMREKSSSVFTSFSRRRLLRWATSRAASRRPAAPFAGASSASSSGPSSSVSGVRNSWLTLLKKVVLARSISASASARRRSRLVRVRVGDAGGNLSDQEADETPVPTRRSGGTGSAPPRRCPRRALSVLGDGHDQRLRRRPRHGPVGRFEDRLARSTTRRVDLFRFPASGQGTSGESTSIIGIATGWSAAMPVREMSRARVPASSKR